MGTAMSIVYVSLLIMAVIVGILSYIARTRKPSSGISKKPILTANEIEFFYRLSRALPDYHVFPQVAFGAILKATGKDRYSARGIFSQKIADYVVCERDTMNILAIIELDDRTHNAEKDAKRDRILASAGYRTIRFNSKKKPNEAEIASYFIKEQEHSF